jgi:hypothetical protein
MPDNRGIPILRQDLAHYGVITAIIDATTFEVAGLGGLGDGALTGYGAYVLTKTNKTVTAPHGEIQSITSYVSSSGRMVHGAYTVPVVVGDEVLLLHPNVANSGVNSSLQGLIYYGVVTAVPGANQFTIPSLANLGAGKFNGATRPFTAFVFRDAGGLGAAPQGEMQPITAYVNGTGTFTTTAYTAAVAVGDEILIVFPALSSASVAVPVVDNVVGNWQAAETALVTLGADDVRNKFHSLIIDINALIGNITIRIYTQVNGVERRVYPIPAAMTFSVAGDAPAIPVLNATWPHHEAMRVTVQSDNAADNGAAVGYDALVEAM